jgi:CBS domain containing-hemolysin-like protein
MGRLHVMDFNRRTGWNVPAERGETLAGLTFNVLARAPRKGDIAHVAGYDIGVIDVSGTRITRVLIRKRPEPAEGEADADTRTAEI